MYILEINFDFRIVFELDAKLNIINQRTDELRINLEDLHRYLCYQF